MMWPRTLFGRLMLILFTGLLLTQALTVGVVLAERGLVMRGVMVSYLTADVASSMAMLDRLPAAEREAWLPRLQRANYQLRLGTPTGAGGTASSRTPLAVSIVESLSEALSQPVSVAGVREPGVEVRLGLLLKDGTPVVVDIAQPRLRLSSWLTAALGGQLLLLVACCWLAVKQITRPLSQLAVAARGLQPGRPATPLPVSGPLEVAEAADAFNLMQHRIEEHLRERSQMLGAISHDLQSPITRMRLRTEMLDDDALRTRLQADLEQMQHLVEQGLAYARASHAVQEPEARTELAALAESIVTDYQDASQPVRWLGGVETIVVTRPQALRRMVGNLIDNAIKFGGGAEVQVSATAGGACLQVMDNGPGIPSEEMERVMLPFYRVEASRNAATGGNGLGLAIVQQLQRPCRAELCMMAREGGGLCVTLELHRDIDESPEDAVEPKPPENSRCQRRSLPNLPR